MIITENKTMKLKLLYAGILTILTLNCHAGGGLNPFTGIDKSKFSVFIAGGANELGVNTSLAPNTTLTDGAIDDSGKVLEFGVGFTHSKRIFSTVAVQRNALDIADIDNIYGSINYQFPMKKAQPFIGALVGYSQLNWSKRPYPVFINENLKSKSFIYGLQVGIEKEVSKNYSIFMKYQYIKYDHEIEILNNTSNIEHDSGQSLLIGMQYIF